TLARHPSETEQRLMVRILAFALHASDALQFTRGLSSSDEPELWEQSLSGEQLHWILLGQPDVKWLKKACNQARRVTLLCYGGRRATQWWNESSADLQRFDNLSVINVHANALTQLKGLLQRSMDLQCSVQDEVLWLSNDNHSVE